MEEIHDWSVAVFFLSGWPVQHYNSRPAHLLFPSLSPSPRARGNEKEKETLLWLDRKDVVLWSVSFFSQAGSLFFFSSLERRKGRTTRKRKGTIGSPFWNRMPVTGSQSVPCFLFLGLYRSSLSLRARAKEAGIGLGLYQRPFFCLFLLARATERKRQRKEPA